MNQVLADWKRFLDGLPTEGLLRAVILDSWSRCRASHVDPQPERPVLRRVADDELQQRLEASDELLAAARPHLRWVTASMGQVRHVVYLVDADGIVLASTGNAPDLMQACGLLPGYDWSEATMGTNGAGTALAANQPVAIVGPEHFCRAWHDATCVAAPVRAPDGRTIGAVDITTPVADGCSERVTLAWHIAYVIEQELAHRRTRQHANRLRRLAEASLAINSTRSLNEVLRLVTEEAREIIGAHMAVTGQTVDENGGQAIDTVSLSDKYAAWRGGDAKPDGSGTYPQVCRENRSMRLTQAEVDAHPAWRRSGAAAGAHPPLRGWLAAPLVGRDGKNLGLIQLSDKYEGDFTEEDEAILVQLAQMASVAIENTRLYRETRDAVHARDAFLARASHELRTPLTSALGTIRLLGRVMAGASKARPEELLTIANRNLGAMLALVNDLLDASKLAAGQTVLACEAVDVVAVVKASLEIVGIQACEKGVALRAAVPTNLPLAGDPLKLEQVLVNLLANAVKFTPAGGEVTIEAESESGQVVMRVRDTGEGIAREHLEAIFEPFFQAGGRGARRPRGTGLGLAICRQIVALHGGRIWAESEGPGRGATFVVRLPGGSAGGRAA